MAIDKNNTNWGAAAFGSQVGVTDNTTNTVDSYDPDQSDDDQLDLDVANSGNDSSTEANDNNNNNSTNLNATDVLNDKSINTKTDNSDHSNDDVNNTDNSLDLSANDFMNDKSVNTNTDNSDHSNDDVVTNTDNSSDDDSSYADSFNSVDTDLDLAFSDSSVNDSYNDSSSSSDDDTTVTDSGNFDLSVDIADSFNDNDVVDIDSLTSPIESIQALGGNGNIFDIDQILTMDDQDSLSSPTVTNDGCFDQTSDNVSGGEASAYSDFNDATGDASIAANASASAGGAANLSAFNQDIAMGANIQYASVDMSVVGGSDGVGLAGDDA
ncbi:MULTISPECIES: hypothetical protein [unclassified Aureimonas]|uniref:hypothetical protein n=1 Tax=unclassified Aureimonas TaxID=2615206 RepID=UPI0006FC5A80|nr:MULTISPECIES: hypothetical protein [unclassified Aureimonas]KQT64063.1 hypothetical protein ASG62_03345 [Aureimonas sp. Leaf427]KQT81255.1 hypothetical protein ASG54_00615 [Aureimonas sp. Leaf460]